MTAHLIQNYGDLSHQPVNSIAEKHVFERWPSLAYVSGVFAKPKGTGMKWKHRALGEPQRKKTNKTHVDARKMITLLFGA